MGFWIITLPCSKNNGGKEWRQRSSPLAENEIPPATLKRIRQLKAGGLPRQFMLDFLGEVAERHL